MVPSITITLDGRGGRQYAPGETLAGSYRLEPVGMESISAIEISILWYTEGKGSEDMGIHEFWRLSVDSGDWIDLRRPGRFSTTLPQTPLSYHGITLRIHWCVRIRVFLTGNRESMEELPFLLGNLPDVRTLKLN
ncbi:MAG: hypothetical protein LBQ54_14695 [Planctomycetaceae bacterium]|jgi:hypothetical protein|nr:hypothetical protein [Planctomycetaceae bacterium]